MALTPAELGAIVRARRLELGRTQVDVIAAAREATGASISEPTMRAVENGRTAPSDLTMASISRGLDWPADALRRIRDGEDPAAFARGEGEAARIVALAGRLTPEQRARVEGFMEGLLGDDNGGSR